MLQELLQWLFNMAQVFVLLSVLLHWLDIAPHQPFARMVRLITEPMYRPARLITDHLPGPFDCTPMVTLMMLIGVQRLLLSLPL